MSEQIFPTVDVHTHIYPPSYISLLSSRKSVPYIYQPTSTSLPQVPPPPRLIILPGDDDQLRPPESRGRPIDATYSSWSRKLSFMAMHGITASVVSLANPWLDFLDPSIAADIAKGINDDMNAACETQNAGSSSSAEADADGKPPGMKLFAFGTLPLSASASQIVTEIERLSTLKYIKGIIIGTTGLGSGLDDPMLDPVYAALESTGTMSFLHPHYGLPAASYGPGSERILQNSGHVLPLALGFPLETTIAVTRMYLSGVFDRFPKIKFLLAHSGGTLPFLAGRIESCVMHEREFVGSAVGGTKEGPKRSIWDVLKKNIWLDAVIYGAPGLKGAIAAADMMDGEEGDGTERLMFGTDHPFFPPLEGEKHRIEKEEEQEMAWLSVLSNQKAIEDVCGKKTDAAKKILGGNAVRILRLEL